MKLVSDTAGEVYEGYKKAPPALQYLSAGAAAKQFLMDEPEGAPKDKYKATPYSGLSPDFQPGGPSPYLYGFADGGITGGGPVEQMSNMNAIGGNEMYPMANIPRLDYANPVQQRPISENIMTMGGDAPTDPYTGQLKFSGGGYAEDRKTTEEAAQRKRYTQMLSGKSGSELENDIAQGQAIAAKARGSSDGIRLYNDPATVTITLANMGEGVAIAEALAASAAAATAAQTAAAQQAAQAAAQQAGQAGIMSGSAVPPPGVTPPGVPGLGAPMPPATPLPPAGGTPFTPPAPATPPPPAGVDAMGVPDVSTSGGLGNVQPGDTTANFINQVNALPPEPVVDPTAPVQQALAPTPGPTPPVTGPAPVLPPPPPA